MSNETDETQAEAPTEATEETPAATEQADAAEAAATPEVPAEDEQAPADEESAPEAEEGGSSAKSDYQSGRAFADFPLSPGVLEGLHGLGYTPGFTQVQATDRDEPELAGRDLLVRLHRLRYWKTCAFCVPMIENVEEGTRKVQGIVLAPTRELANQIAEECAGICTRLQVLQFFVYGGVTMGPQIQALEEGVEIVIGTPGRVLDHIRRGNLDLSNIRSFCLDEADEMLSMGFYEDVAKILDSAPKESQTLLFSATVKLESKRLGTEFLNDPVDIMLSTDTDKVEGITNVLLRRTPRSTVFELCLRSSTKRNPARPSSSATPKKTWPPLPTSSPDRAWTLSLSLWGLPQGKRTAVMAKVKSGRVQFLVATGNCRSQESTSPTSLTSSTTRCPKTPLSSCIESAEPAASEKRARPFHWPAAPSCTRKVLERQFDISFEVKPMPTQEEAGELRLNRQLEAIRKVAGTTAFEGFLPLVKALRKGAETMATFSWPPLSVFSSSGSASSEPKNPASTAWLPWQSLERATAVDVAGAEADDATDDAMVEAETAATEMAVATERVATVQAVVVAEGAATAPAADVPAARAARLRRALNWPKRPMFYRPPLSLRSGHLTPQGVGALGRCWSRRGRSRLY